MFRSGELCLSSLARSFKGGVAKTTSAICLASLFCSDGDNLGKTRWFTIPGLRRKGICKTNASALVRVYNLPYSCSSQPCRGRRTRTGMRFVNYADTTRHFGHGRSRPSSPNRCHPIQTGKYCSYRRKSSMAKLGGNKKRSSSSSSRVSREERSLRRRIKKCSKIWIPRYSRI